MVYHSRTGARMVTRPRLISPIYCLTWCWSMPRSIYSWLLILGLVWPNASQGELRKGDPAPDFTLQQLGGGQVSLSDFRGKVVLIDIFGYA